MKPMARASGKRVRGAPAPPINFSDHLEALAQKSPKQRDREKTRYLLLASVVRFSEAGSFAAMTVKDVVKGAGTSHGASETSQERDEELLIELHATLSYRAIFGQEPPPASLKRAASFTRIAEKLR